MAGLLSGYRQFLLPIRRAPTVGATDVSNLFDEPAFLRSRDKAYHPFYRLLLPTQLFTKFVEECSFVSDVNQHLAFFDECMERLERPHEGAGGRLLEVEGALSDRTVFILPPDTTDLPAGKQGQFFCQLVFLRSGSFSNMIWTRLFQLRGSDLTLFKPKNNFHRYCKLCFF